MQAFLSRRRKLSATLAATLCVILLAMPLAGCSSDRRYDNPPPPVDDTRGGAIDSPYHGGSARAPAPQEQQGMSTGKKVVLLAGAAALYYLYQKHQNAQAPHGPESQYYLSKNGRVYYRDAEGRAHWVTPPPEGIQVPESEAHAYQHFEGYQNRPTGMSLEELARTQSQLPDYAGS
jgi:hypothetical protein